MAELDKPIYLDHNATTPLDQRVLDAMMPYMRNSFGNASSLDHTHGYDASTAVESARTSIARCIGARHDEIIFTSGATESDNLAIRGVMERNKEGNHMITCVTEHEAVLETARYLESIGKKVTYLPVNELGRFDFGELEDAITDKTVLISIMAANNGIGTIADLKKVGSIARKKNVLFHTDAAQAVGNIPIDASEFNIDLMSLSAHKMYGPKGVGALYVRGINPRVKLDRIVFGGGQERGLRSGTLNVAGIVGFGKAVEIAVKIMDSEQRRQKTLSNDVLKLLQDNGALLNGDWQNRLAGNINVCFSGIEGKAIINSVSKHISISAGSACTTKSVEPSHVIMALGHGEGRAHSSIRIGIGRYIDEDESKFAAWKIIDSVRNLGRIIA